MRSRQYSTGVLSQGGGLGSGQQGRPELADIGRLTRRAMQRTVAAARADQAPLRVSDAHMAAALDQLLDIRGPLTRVLLDGAAPATRRRGGGEGGS